MEEDSVYEQLAAIFESEAKTCTAETKKVLRKHANRFRKNVSEDSPKRTGEYAKGWRAKVEHESEFDLEMVVSNAKKPTLPHLLEKRHAIIVRKGKRGGYAMVDTGKETKPHPHILGNAEMAIEDFYNELMKGGDG